MRRLIVALSVAAAITVPAVSADDVAPIVTTARIAVKDAPKLRTEDHGRIGQNAEITWWRLVPGPRGDALFGACKPVRALDDGAPKNTPALFRLDLRTGALTEYLPEGKMVRREVPAEPGRADEDDLGALLKGPPTSRMYYTGWRWGDPLCVAVAPQGRVIFGTRDGKVVRLDVAEGLFEEVLSIRGGAVVGVTVSAKGELHLISSDGQMYAEDILGHDLIGTPRLRPGKVSGLAMDRRGVLYTTVGPAPWTLYAVAGRGKRMKTRRLLGDQRIETVRLLSRGGAAWARVTIRNGDGRATRWFRLEGGKAKPLDASPLGYTVSADFRTDPAVVVKTPDGKSRPLRVVFRRAAWARVKSITVGPDGRRVYGGCWPTAWIYEYDPATGRIRRPGVNYVWYEITPYRGSLYVIAYYGIRLMRWDPDRPWTFDWGRHYSRKQPYPGHSSPFGAKDSNPRLVCMFRYMRNLNIRRPAGFAVGGDGRIYTGAKNPAVMFYVDAAPHTIKGYRYSGALCWYDPETETIGQERGPFLHHEVTDICRVGNDYIAVVDKARLCYFEPAPEPFGWGRLLLFDVKKRAFVHESVPTGYKVWYVDEGAPGQVVGFASPGRYRGDGVRSVLFVFDTRTMKYTRIIRLPVGVRWGQYDHCGKFERGPDHKVYFYGHDKDGTALFRVDSRTGAVEPVFFERGVTNFRVYNNPGAAFCFGKDRIYFGTHGIRSLSFEKAGVRPVEKRKQPR